MGVLKLRTIGAGNILANLYNYLIYCGLFHHDIDEIYGQSPPNVQPLTSKSRRLWMLHCICDIYYDGVFRLSCGIHQLRDFERMLDYHAWFDYHHLDWLFLSP
jgi:hypothetical protein